MADLWQLRISCPDAYSINLLYETISSCRMARRSSCIMTDHRYLIGAFTSYNNKEDGRFATQPVPGDAITIEYSEPAAVANQGIISIMRVVHAYRNVFGYASPLDGFMD